MRKDPQPVQQAVRTVAERGRKVILRSGLRRYLLIPVDGLIGAVGFWLAMLLRFDTGIPPEHLQGAAEATVLLAIARMGSSLLLRVHQWSFRLSSLVDAARVLVSAVLGTGVFVLLLFLFRVPFPPRSVVVLELLAAMVLMEAARFTPRLAWHYLLLQTLSSSEDSRRTIIVGAGAAGELLLRDLQRSDEHHYLVLGFVDDNQQKQGMVVGGRSVLGAVKDLPRLATELRLESVLIAVPRLEPQRIREILSLCEGCKLSIKMLPVSFTYLNERTVASMLQELTPEDLLPRPEVDFHSSGDLMVIHGRRALVTGAAGSIGSEICRQVVHAGVSELVMVDLNENELYLQKLRLSTEYPATRIEAEIADIRDAGRMSALFDQYRPQDVFHAAAHKHVPLMETAPCEAVKNNVIGTRNVALAADRAGAERMVYISTDKAVRPTSVMGVSKRVGELVVRAIGQRSRTRFVAVRFGNVLGSAGSVTLIFREQIAARRPVTVTHPEVRRYFMTIGEAVALVLKAGYSDRGDLCILEMGEQIRIVDLARHMITMAGMVPNVDVPIVFTGLRPGEKLFEELLTEAEESTVKLGEKIYGAASPPPPADLDERIEALAAAAAAEDGVAVKVILARIVPSYAPALNGDN
jgi:FlaA1/EpsC-like NDP-sugar epimerase